ncbi:Bgt-1016 [Blumeria graminis f. sp. tritici]|uniref:Bgt-1016 n=2 Tax=Blumeria graminis f. sp. tritici TaxID=62690 RepID=A0A061HDW9_BLUGR|nr:hypothetical protein BGT96224_1016 [Blumeria graminis f. sp. tritici 96224]VCU41035.1 Bgt-1016 [Blumeria graminis f. sp. tritici]
MSNFKDKVKSSWNTRNKDGKLTNRLRDDFKGLDQVAGWMGKERDQKTTNDRESRVAVSYKDPSTFKPPPKRINSYVDTTIQNHATSDIKESLSTWPSEKKQIGDLEERKLPPPVPSRDNSSGSKPLQSTPRNFHLNGLDGERRNSENCPEAKPGPPPRLPPRKASSLIASSVSDSLDLPKEISKNGPSLSGGASIKQSCLQSSALARSYLSTPRNVSPLENVQSCPSTITSLTSPKSASVSEGTTFAEKRAALKTASSLRNNPSSVSFHDVKTAAGTAKSFQERHGNQVKTGLHLAQRLQGNRTSDEVESPQHATVAGTRLRSFDQAGSFAKTVIDRKVPPIPPRKRVNQVSPKIATNYEPPSIPIHTKPKIQSV